MYDIVIFRGELYPIGGIETWAINLARRYGKTHKMAVVYGSVGSHATLHDIAQHCEVIKYTGQTIKTKKAVFCYDFLGISTCQADEVYHIIHADHSAVSLPNKIPEGVDKFFSVSEVARQGLLKTADIDSEVVYNPVHIPDFKPVIRMVSGTRLTNEKGLDRMIELAKALDSSGVVYEWHIFTNHNQRTPFSPNVIFREPTRHLISHIKGADYLVQLSDTESYGYSMVESLSVGTPIIVTDIPVLPEIGVSKDNAIIVPLSGADYADIAKQVATRKFNFKYTPPKDGWDKVFGKGSGNDYRYKPIKLLNNFGGVVTLMQEGIDVQHGDTVTLYDKSRADYIVRMGYLEYVD